MYKRFIVLVFTTLIAVTGWFRPDETPLWLNITAIILFLGGLLFEILIAFQSQKDNGNLKKQISELHVKASREPAFDLSLNNITISEEKLISIDKDGEKYPLEFRIKNIGSKSADNIQIHLLVPSELDVPFLGKHWTNQGTPEVFNDEKFKSLNGVIQYSFIYPVSIHPDDWLKLGHGYLVKSFIENNPIPLRFKISIEEGKKEIWNFNIVLNG